jgi:hypothetical protein
MEATVAREQGETRDTQFLVSAVQTPAAAGGSGLAGPGCSLVAEAVGMACATQRAGRALRGRVLPVWAQPQLLPQLP